ncbi:hypothetical protein BHM03_00018079 [Ensete ventricosum]|nr:hypothetical protein BHM03_00018079 [Ensete ventricosum]
MAAVRSALLSHLRVRVESPAAPAVALSFVHIIRRRFSNEVMGSFLDKPEVADRIITVVKNFQKVDPSKVHYQIPLLSEFDSNPMFYVRSSSAYEIP